MLGAVNGSASTSSSRAASANRGAILANGSHLPAHLTVIIDDLNLSDSMSNSSGAHRHLFENLRGILPKYGSKLAPTGTALGTFSGSHLSGDGSLPSCSVTAIANGFLRFEYRGSESNPGIQCSASASSSSSNSRFTRHFFPILLDQLTTNSMDQIFSTLLHTA